MLKDLYETNNKEKDSLLVGVINIGIKDLKKEIERCLKKKNKFKSQIKY